MWRYKLLAVPDPGQDESRIKAWETKLNELGGEGWEAVAMVERAGGWYVLLKMPHEVGTF